MAEVRSEAARRDDLRLDPRSARTDRSTDKGSVVAPAINRGDAVVAPNSAGRLRASMGACRSRTNADDRLPLAPLGRVEGGDGIVEGRNVADVCPQPSVTHPPDDLTQLLSLIHISEP